MQIGVHLVPENLNHLLRLAFAKQTMVDTHTGQLLADRFDQKCRNDRRINTAGQSQQNLLITDLFPQRCKLLVNEGLCKFRGGNPLHALRAFVFSHMRILRLIRINFPQIIAQSAAILQHDFIKNLRSFE